MTGLRAVLFDFGGTLDGPGLPWVERFADAYAAASLVVPFDQLREACGHATREAYRAAALAGCDLRATVAFHVACQFARLKIEDPGAAQAVVSSFVRDATAALADSRRVLERLRPRFQLGVVSNFYGNVERILADAAIAPLLGVIIDSSVVGVSKPDPRIFRLALDRLGVDANETLYVGDSLDQDIAPARTAGLRTAWLHGSSGGRPRGPAAAPDIELRDLADLDRVL